MSYFSFEIECFLDFIVSGNVPMQLFKTIELTTSPIERKETKKKQTTVKYFNIL